MKHHSILPPSAADKWMTCYGWYKATEGLPNVSSIYAEEGTKAHELLELTLRLGLPPSEMTQDVDLALNLALVTDWLKDYKKRNKKSDYYVEKWVSWGEAIGKIELGGTIDLAVVGPDELIVGDYKHGAGIVVEVMDNRQLMLYLIGLINRYKSRKKYRIIIFQPRARHEDGPIREYPVDHVEVRDFIEEVKRAVKENFKGGERKAGEHCRFCLAAGSCKTLARYSIEAAGEEFSSPDAD
jgi:hypothetical protein